MTETEGPKPDPDMADIKRRRAVILVTVALILAVVGWNSWPHIGGWDGPTKNVHAGCYKGGDTMVRLSAEGFLHTPDGNWPYEIDHKRLKVDEIAVARQGAGVRFSRAPHGQGIEERISRKDGFKLGDIAFEPAACEGMERNS